ncbi:MAG: type II toxin-antitoxin system VapC family toxin [Anaerolineaceae bacterium]|nr:type II toxin-antitoxin system VapC family toxin [Anaerolineaceae bacterium]
MANGSVFVDSNVLLHYSYQEVGSDPLDIKRVKHKLLSRFRQENKRLWINGQVIREFWRSASLLQMQGRFLASEEITQTLQRAVAAMHLANETPAVRDQLLTLLQKYDVRGIAVHDANIVATMLAHDIGSVCTLDAGFERYRRLITIVSPLTSTA